MRKLPLLLVLAAAQLCAPPVLGGGLINPFSRYRDSLSDADMKLLSGSITKALEERKAGAKAAWSDDTTGVAGEATVLKVYQKNGADCGSVRHKFTRGGNEAYTLPYCHQKDGTWKIQF